MWYVRLTTGGETLGGIWRVEARQIETDWRLTPMAATSFRQRALTHVRTRQRNKLRAGYRLHGWVKDGGKIAVGVGRQPVATPEHDLHGTQSGESAPPDGVEAGDANGGRDVVS